MIIVGLSGGLGNQLQQYAIYKKFLYLGVDARVDISWYDEKVQEKVAARRSIELDRLDGIDYKICSKAEKAQLVGDALVERLRRRIGLRNSRVYCENVIYDPEMLRLTDMYIEGSFVCEYYYADILPEIRKNIRFPVEKCQNCSELFSIIDDIKSHYSISVHFRRGDYLDRVNEAIYGNICTDEYYSSAIDFCLNNSSEPKKKLYFFSDDADYAIKYASMIAEKYDNLALAVVNINHGSDSLFDMLLMSLCDCNITANSTFSYWGARLNNKDNAIMIKPYKHKNSQQFEPEEMLRLWQGWTIVDSEGRVYR